MEPWYGHQYATNHLSDDYFRALTKLDGRTAILATAAQSPPKVAVIGHEAWL